MLATPLRAGRHTFPNRLGTVPMEGRIHFLMVRHPNIQKGAMSGKRRAGALYVEKEKILSPAFEDRGIRMGKMRQSCGRCLRKAGQVL